MDFPGSPAGDPGLDPSASQCRLNSMAGAEYLPRLSELAVTIGLFSGGILVFGFAMKNLPMEEEAGHEGVEVPCLQPGD